MKIDNITMCLLHNLNFLLSLGIIFAHYLHIYEKERVLSLFLHSHREKVQHLTQIQVLV